MVRDKALVPIPREASSDLSAERLKDDPRQNACLSPRGGWEQGHLHEQEHFFTNDYRPGTTGKKPEGLRFLAGL